MTERAKSLAAHLNGRPQASAPKQKSAEMIPLTFAGSLHCTRAPPARVRTDPIPGDSHQARRRARQPITREKR
jgi:hypothetical protein